MVEKLSFQIKLSDSFEGAVEKVTLALKEEGFGVLTQIDVKATLKEKLDADFRPFTILGACNPTLAHKALESEPQVGLLLPCNVTVEQISDGSLVSIVNPQAMLGIKQLEGNSDIQDIAAEARFRLKRVADSLNN